MAEEQKKCPYCAESINIAAIKCKHCGEILDPALKSTRTHQTQSIIIRERKWSPGVTAVLSLVIPGAGQMYKGDVGIGLLYLIFTSFSYLGFYASDEFFMSLILGLSLHLTSILTAPRGNPYGEKNEVQSQEAASRKSVGEKGDQYSYLIVLLLVIVGSTIILYKTGLISFFLKKERLLDFLNSLGPFSFIGFIILQTVEVIISPIPGEVIGFMGGYIYGIIPGIFLSTVGLIVGSWIAFSISKFFGKPFVNKSVKKEAMERYDTLLQHKGVFWVFVLFLIPGFPKDLLCYILGLAPLTTKKFLIISTLGRFSSIILLTFGSSSIYHPQYKIFFILIGIAVIVAFFSIVYMNKLVNRTSAVMVVSLCILGVITIGVVAFHGHNKKMQERILEKSRIQAVGDIKADNTIVEKNGFSVKVEKPLIKGDFIVFLFRINNNSPYWAKGTYDSNLLWEICGMGNCEQYDGYFFGSNAKEDLSKEGYEGVSFVEMKPGEKSGLFVPKSLQSQVVQGNKIKVSNISICCLYDEFKSRKECHGIEAMFEKNGNEISPISISLK